MMMHTITMQNCPKNTTRKLVKILPYHLKYEQTFPEKEVPIQQELEQQKRRTQEAEERVQLFKNAIAQYQQQIEDKSMEIQEHCKRNRVEEERLHKLEESVQAAIKQMQEKELLLTKNHETIQDLQSQLKQSDEIAQRAEKQAREKE